MYCLEKLQRELAYFFDMDLRELPRVQDLLVAKGYTQVQKGDEIIKLESSQAQKPADKAESNLATPKQKTIEKIDSYASTPEFKALSKDKQDVILSLKTIEPSPMPQGISIKDLEHLQSHFSGKPDKEQREKFLTLFNDTKDNPHIVLEVLKNGEIRQEYIKAYQHKESKDLYYIAISKDERDITGIPTTQIQKIINDIAKSERVIKEAENFQGISNTAAPLPKQMQEQTSPERSSEIIPQSTQEKPKWSRADSKKWKLAKLEQTKAAARELYEQLQPIYNQARPLLIKAKELKSTAKAKELKDKAWKLIEQESKPFIKELEQHELELDRTAFTLYPETASIKIQPKSNFDLEYKARVRGAQGLKGAAKYRAQALQRLNEKDYMTPFEQATKASNPLTSLHALKFEILKDLHKAKLYINQQDYDKDLHKTYLDYVNRTSSELDSIEQSIRKLKNAIMPKPQRVQEVRSKVQDFIKWRDEVRFDTNYLLTLESDSVRHALEYLERQLQAATLPQQRNFIHQLKEQIQEYFSTPPTPPTQKSLFDEVDSSDIIFTDKNGKEHTLTQEVQEQWLETFNLKSLDEAYTPKLPQDLQEAIGKEIRLTKGSLYKIVEKGREQYIPQIKETLEKPDFALKDESELIFAKQIKDDLYLTSIGKDFDTHITIISNSPKTDKTIQNKLKNGKMIYKAENAEALPTSGAFTETNQVPISKDIIPQREIRDIKKQLVELKKSKLEYQKILKSLERNMKDVELDERRYLLGDERIKVFERKRLVQSSIDEHTEGLNAVLKKMIELHKQLPENLRYTKEVLDDLTKIGAILKGNDYSLEQALRLSKITQRLQEKAIIESEFFLNKVYDLDKFAKDAKSLRGTSYGYNTDTIRKNFKIIAEMIDSIPAFKISAKPTLTTPQETLPAGVKTRVNNLMTKINDLYNAASNISHDKLQAQIKSIKDPQVLRAFLQQLDETYTEPKGFIKLSRDLAQKNLEAYSNPQVQEILAVLGGASKPRDKTKVRELYQRYGTPELKGLFDKVLDIVGDIPFEVKKIPTKLGNYNLTHHTIALDEKLLIDKNIDRFMQTLLHELIHATIARAQYHLLSPKNYPDLAHKLTPAQKSALKEIDDLYILAFKTHQAQKRAKTLGDDEQKFYGLTNSKEFVAELANPNFRRYLEKQNIFKRVLEAIVKFFTGGGGEQTTILKALQESYEKYLDNFGESSESFFGKKEGGASPSENITLFDRDLDIDFNTPMREIKPQILAALKPIFNQTMQSADGKVQAYLSVKSLSKMTSDKAIQKSIDNGFSREEHLRAVLDIQRLFENARLQATEPHKSGEKNAVIHRLNSELESGNALITTKESLDINKNRIYSIELELTPRFNDSSTPLNTKASAGGFNSQKGHQEQTIKAEPSIAKTDEQSIAQDSNELLESTMKSFNYDEKKAKDLLEWHKDSHPLTKDEKNGVPKVFYHGTRSDKVFEVFDKDKIHSGYGFWFGDDIADRAVKENTTGKAPVIKAFLQMKKPFIFSNQGITAQNIDEYAYITGISKKRITELYVAKEAFNTLEKLIQRDTQADSVFAGAVDYFEIEKGGKDLMTFDYRELNLSDQTIAFLDRLHKKGITARGMDITPTRAYEDKQEAKEILERLKEKGYDSMVWANNEFVVFEPNQIKHIENRGIESESGRKYFNESSPNIFQSSPHAGAGLLGGSVAGVEQDESGNITFDPAKFALGLLGGTAGSIAISKAKNTLKSTQKAQGQTMTLKDRLVIDNKIKYSYLKEIAQDLPKPITQDDFLNLLKNKKYANIQTPIKELEIEPLKAYEHLTQNSNKQNRIDISGAILPTLQNPLFITKDKKDTYYFYKPFKDEKGVLNIVSIAIPKSNRIHYKTSYIASRERMLKMINEYDLIYEAF